MYKERRHFSGDEIKLSDVDAAKVFKFFWPSELILPSNLGEPERGMAQAMLVDAVEASYSIGYVQRLWTSMKIPVSFESIREILKEFCKEAAKHWFNHATGRDLEDPKIYENVRVTLGGGTKYKLAWDERKQGTGFLDY